MILYEDFCDGEDLAVKKKGFLMLLVSIHIRMYFADNFCDGLILHTAM